MRILASKTTENAKSRKITGIMLASALALSLSFPSMAFASAQDDIDAANAAIEKNQKAYDEAVELRDSLQAQIDNIDYRLSEYGHYNAVSTISGKRASYLNIAKQLAESKYDSNAYSKIILPYPISESEATLYRSQTLASAYDLISNLKENRENLLEQRREAMSAIGTSMEAINVAKRDKADAEERLAKEEEERKKAEEAARTAGAYSGGFSGAVVDEATARAFIIQKESGGNYSATNGRYYGAYQLDISYLSGDTSPANQDRVAEQYVSGRYGSWQGAYQHWLSHHWY